MSNKQKKKVCSDIMELSEEIGRDAYDLLDCIQDGIEYSAWLMFLRKDAARLERLLRKLVVK